jgi:hypothetical protein
MSSKPRSEPLDLDRGLPTTPEDVRALRSSAAASRVVPEEDYLAFLASSPPPTREELRRRKGPSGPPFRLA